ncbi:hypothetical protein HY480_02500 [Candidatus Uhrbacteria bacterium]|nr:hypothetical protein [Candidatus Uhrbacteria bacterium]
MRASSIVISALLLSFLGLTVWADVRALRSHEQPTVAVTPAPTAEEAPIPWSMEDATPVAGKCGPGSCQTGSCSGNICDFCGREVMTACCEDGNGNCYPCNPMRCPPCPKSCY